MIIPEHALVPSIEQKRCADKHQNSNIAGMSPEEFRLMLLRKIALGCTVPPEAYVDLPKDKV